jgi:hypothetical protein
MGAPLPRHGFLHLLPERNHTRDTRGITLQHHLHACELKLPFFNLPRSYHQSPAAFTGRHTISVSNI